ncbi:transcription factor BIM2 isoform X2 [Rhodamnia argentea]|uniref:Transcription factor BIM2 isoform X1 n=1 Tax=Rhodamnia argentea TaxID=178133 RepID=A0A8B8QNM6_9MYRT|nr:transcription factor BIM2 isoform X2 [Rhodamnia argentea]XP_048128633.1 transcription factor BIM2 isoform X2 [Rhodamnia argentea]XP_048128635.1 transcription factor BIM2 isoform X2 [Rhodamnia argentea]
MVRPAKTPHQHEHDYDDDEETEYGDDFAPAHNSSFQKEEVGKVDGKKGNALRSKHSETEQRRRSKINERFQILRDLIPQNDQKRDKASFLLEVIEYIRFLQEKIQMYEGSYPGYNQEPSKLTPWRSNTGTVESHMDHLQIMKNGSGHESRVDTSPLIANAQNSLESDLANAAVSINMQTQPGMFASVGHGGMASEPLTEAASNVGNVSGHPQSQLWQAMPFAADCSIPNNTDIDQEQFTIESGSVSLSTAYSQGILNTLTQALQSSGVDLSQASISVQIDVGKRASNSAASTFSTLKDHENVPPDSRARVHDGSEVYIEEPDQAPKRLRTEKS